MRTATRSVRAVKRAGEAEEKNRDTVLLILSIGFLAGGILGCLLEKSLSDTAFSSAAFFQWAAQGDTVPSLWRELWITLRWPVAAVVLSILPLAGLTVPTLFFLRGFFLSYGIVSLTEGMGISGTLGAGILFGPTCLLAVPAFFLLGTSGLLRKVASAPKVGKRFRQWMICLLLLSLCVVLDQKVVPKLLGMVLNTFAMPSS